jgi:hypothetical protein
LNPVAKILLHVISSVLFVLAIGWSLAIFSWVPMALFFAALGIVELFYWYDVYRGWPIKESPRIDLK